MEYVLLVYNFPPQSQQIINVSTYGSISYVYPVYLMSLLRFFTVYIPPIQRFMYYKVIFVSVLKLTIKLLKYFDILLTVAHSLPTYVVTLTDIYKVL